MPKPTFFGLPDDKRQLIERVALEEFADQGYAGSNTNRIVERCGIAKGSFYQYFDDKKDLLFHLLDKMVAEKMASLQPVLDNYKSHSFSHNIEALFETGIRYAAADPLLWRFGRRFTGGGMMDLLMEFAAKYRPVSTDLFGELLLHAEANGELRDDIDVPSVAALLTAFVNQASITVVERMTNEQTRTVFIRQMLLFLEHGVLKHSGGNDL